MICSITAGGPEVTTVMRETAWSGVTSATVRLSML